MIKRPEPGKDIGEIIADGTALDRAMVAAQRAAVRRHRLLGVPVVIWRDGQVAIVAADEIHLPDEGGS